MIPPIRRYNTPILVKYSLRKIFLYSEPKILYYPNVKQKNI
ncbi:hypothetical protein DSBG_0476 [Desulfosporosinus sp. BG]|nr:hypothetical protein DSBG_0476 [Desulfosporosinus sp. BG]